MLPSWTPRLCSNQKVRIYTNELCQIIIMCLLATTPWVVWLVVSLIRTSMERKNNFEHHGITHHARVGRYQHRNNLRACAPSPEVKRERALLELCGIPFTIAYRCFCHNLMCRQVRRAYNNTQDRTRILECIVPLKSSAHGFNQNLVYVLSFNWNLVCVCVVSIGM